MCAAKMAELIMSQFESRTCGQRNYALDVVHILPWEGELAQRHMPKTLCMMVLSGLDPCHHLGQDVTNSVLAAEASSSSDVACCHITLDTYYCHCQY